MTTNRGIPSLLPIVLLLAISCAPSAAPSPTAAPAKPAPAAAPTAAPAPTSAPATKPAAAAATEPAAKSAAPSTANTEFQKVLEGAKKETSLAVWITTPNLEPTQRAAIEAFKQRFGLGQLNLEWLPIHQNDASLRILAEAQAGRHAVDVVSASLQNMKPAVDAGLVAKVDWNGTFGQELPGIKEAAGRMISDWEDLGVVHWDVAYVMSYNTDQLKPEAVPTKLEDLVDPKWKGRFTVDSAGAAPFDTMALDWGKDKTLELVKQILGNNPVFKNGTPAVIVAVGQGEAAVGMGQITGTQTETVKGAPIAWKPMTYVPVLPLYLYVAKNAPSPNAARLFTAWTVTEGMKVQEEKEYLGRVTDPNSFIAKEVKKVAPESKVVQPRSLKDATLQEDVSKAIVSLRSGS